MSTSNKGIFARRHDDARGRPVNGHQRLLGQTGFRMVRKADTPTDFSVVEARVR
ncbi:hypothetical protein I550_4329 [Mycobacterium intracellulare 1956]|uniref:Uncharacterized protein n=1 Tax=Mycobacterium intracellulare 1956 TaxID=1299331 RepID=X8CLN7_MYCIT|nr:hypothetical protein I548_1287 [Mycobacterium intracellulare]EUA56170.1 hypothetical protein I550_4329 [Mycobacterium intracellulare 1956]